MSKGRQKWRRRPKPGISTMFLGRKELVERVKGAAAGIVRKRRAGKERGRKTVREQHCRNDEEAESAEE